MKLYISEIEKLLDSGNVSNHLKKMSDIFLAAINDWPDSILTLDDYEIEIEKFIGGATKKNKINEALLKIDFSLNAWQAESLSQISEIFQFYNDNISLKEIIHDFKIKFRTEVKI